MTYPEAKKIDAVTTYLILGNAALTAKTIGVPLITLRYWRQQPWWKELELEVQTESDQQLDSKLSKRIEKALDLVNDRLDNGDFQYDPRTGSFIRKPVNIRDGWKVANEMIDRRWLIRKQPKDQTSQEAVGDILKNLANEFAQMARKRVSERVIDADVVVVDETINQPANQEVKHAKAENPQQSEAAGQEGQVEVLDGGSESK